MATVPTFWLFTVADARLLANGDLRACLESVAGQKIKGNIRHHVLLAGPTKAQLAELKRDYPHASFFVEETLKPLSYNRNVLLRPVLDAGLIQDEDFVAFPDDDLSYSKGYLAKVMENISGLKVDCLITSFNDKGKEGVHPMFANRPTGVLTPMQRRPVVASPCMFFTGKFAKAVGTFDERLGLGTAVNSCEDDAYVYEGLRRGFGYASLPDMVVQHPVKTGNFYKYFMAGALSTAKFPHASLSNFRIFLKLCRKLVFGMVYVLQGKVSWKNYRGVVLLLPTYMVERWNWRKWER